MCGIQHESCLSRIERTDEYFISGLEDIEAPGVALGQDKADEVLHHLLNKTARNVGRLIAMTTEMNTSSRSVLFVGPLVLGLLVSACGDATTASLLPSAPSSIGSSPQSLVLPTNTTWTLQSLTETGLPEITITDPNLFTLVLTDDGKLQARADCNRASAGYTVANTKLSVGLIASTMAQCASAPIDGQYLALLGGENVVATDGATLQLSSPRGTLRFVK